MTGTLGATFGQSFRGVISAIRERPALFSATAVATLALSVALPPLLLSVARKPADYFTVNPWLRRLPEYLAAPSVPWRQKLEKLPDLALFGSRRTVRWGAPSGASSWTCVMWLA